MEKQKYIVTAKKLVGHPQGSVIELSEDQAKTALYRNRVRLADSGAQLEVASPASGKTEDEQKDELIAQLAELDIKADKRSSVESLKEKLEEALAN